MSHSRHLAMCAVLFTVVVSVLHMIAVPCSAESKSVTTLGFSRESFLGTVQGTWRIEAGSIAYDQSKQVYTAEGGVRITSHERVIQADWATVDMEKRQAELRGHVFLQYGRNWLKGEYVLWNLDMETGWLDGGLIYFAENQLYAEGKYITKIGPHQFEMKEGFLTSCDPANSDWKIKYDEMNVNLNGLAWATHTSFWIRDFPVFYSPYIALPVDQRRQSGFLLPWAGYSKLDGAAFEIPFYWAMRGDMDATLFGRYMEKRGFMAGAEYRINHRTWGEGVWAVNYLRDQADKDFLFDQGYPFQTRDRYWVRARHNFDLPGEIEARLNLDYVSDRNFLQEFTKGSVSYDYSNKVFRDYFGRGILDDKTSLTRESALYLDKRTESTLVGLDIRYWEQLDDSRDEFTFERLPAVSFNVIPSWIERLPVYYTFDSSLVNYWRREGYKGDRLDVYPRVHYPMHYKNYIDIEPSVGMRASSYWVDWGGDSSLNQLQGRFLTDVRMEMSTRLNRVYPIKIGDYVALEHAIRPEVVYEYVPEAIQGDIPRFDRLDQDQARNALRYGFTTFLTAKEVRQDSEGNSVTSYREFARLKLYQLFNIEDPPPDEAFFNFGEEQGFTSVGMRIDLMPKRYLTLSYDANLYSDSPNGYHQDFLLTLDDGKGHAVRFDYQFREDMPVNELTTEVVFKTFSNLYLNTYHDYSFDQGTIYKQGYGIKYLRGCWALGVAFEKEDNDERVIVSLNLLGLGNLVGSFGYKTGESPSGLP